MAKTGRNPDRRNPDRRNIDRRGTDRRGTDRRGTEQRLIELNSITADAESLRPYLEDESSHVVAKAAAVVRDEGVADLDAALRAAFTRFAVDPAGPDSGGLGPASRGRPGRKRASRDPGCTAKLRLLEALDRLDHDDPEPFRVAARYVQLEPAYAPGAGNAIDTAAPLRIRGALGLVRLRTPDVLVLLAEHLADVPTVQSAAAVALAEHGDPAGRALVRLRILAGVEDGEALTDCLCALLSLDSAGDALAFVLERLDGPDTLHARAAALALGEMRPEGAFEALRRFHDRSIGEDLEIARTAIGLLRTRAAEEFLAASPGD